MQERALCKLERATFHKNLLKTVGTYPLCHQAPTSKKGGGLIHLYLLYGMFLQNVLDKVNSWLPFA